MVENARNKAMKMRMAEKERVEDQIQFKQREKMQEK
jgi:hypothetical protein